MRTFSINTLQNITGIKAHTIRIWEKRYSILEPQRTDTNYRFYTVDELRLLLNIALLTNNGHKISNIAGLSEDALNQKIEALPGEDVRCQAVVNNLVCHMFSKDIDKFEDVLEEELLNRDSDALIEQIIMPFMKRVDLFSYDDTTAEVHLVVTAIRKKLIVGIESITNMSRGTSALLFLPKNEHYDLMLLYITYAIKKKGFRTIYLGTNISQETLFVMAAEKQPDAVFTYFTPKNNYNFQAYADVTERALPHAPLYIVSSEGEGANIDKANAKTIHYKDLSTISA